MEKNPLHDALKSFYFRKKKVDAQKGIFFLFYQIVRETLFYEKVEAKNYESQFRRFRDENIVYLAFKFLLNKNNLAGWQLLTVHNYT